MSTIAAMFADTLTTYTKLQPRLHSQLQNTYIFACQHIRNPRAEMLEIIERFGIPKQNIYLLGKSYSTNIELQNSLMDSGYHILQPDTPSNLSFDIMHQINCQRLFEVFIQTVSDGARVIVLDDGGMLLTTFMDNYDQYSSWHLEIAGIEQTSSGYRILSERQALAFPVINVARSTGKLQYETPHLARICAQQLATLLQIHAVVNPRIIMMGMGNVGSEIFRNLQQSGFNVSGFDIKTHSDDPVGFIQKCLANVVVGATGDTSLGPRDIEKLSKSPQPIYLASVSSSDREFSAHLFRANQDSVSHDDFKYGNLVYLNNGYPINFSKIAQSFDINWIAHTMQLLLSSILFLANLNSFQVLQCNFINAPQEPQSS